MGHSESDDFRAVWHPGPPAVVRAYGEIDVYNAPRLAEVLADASPGEPLLLDLEGVSFLDASALGVIARQASGRPGGLRIVGATPFIAKVIRTVGLEQLLAG